MGIKGRGGSSLPLGGPGVHHPGYETRKVYLIDFLDNPTLEKPKKDDFTFKGRNFEMFSRPNRNARKRKNTYLKRQIQKKGFSPTPPERKGREPTCGLSFWPQTRKWKPTRYFFCYAEIFIFRIFREALNDPFLLVAYVPGPPFLWTGREGPFVGGPIC